MSYSPLCLTIKEAARQIWIRALSTSSFILLNALIKYLFMRAILRLRLQMWMARRLWTEMCLGDQDQSLANSNSRNPNPYNKCMNNLSKNTPKNTRRTMRNKSTTTLMMTQKRGNNKSKTSTKQLKDWIKN